MAVFEVNNLSQFFRGDPPVHALDDISLSVAEGELVVVLGPSGCGKSTLLEILSGLQTGFEGEVLLNRRPITGTSSNLGIVFQDPSLLPWRTVTRNVELGLELRGIDKGERRRIAEHYLDSVGLSGFGDKYPHQLSGGMKQRAGIARALANEPDVLLMDEPFGAVDYLTRIKLQEDLLRIWEESRKTIVFVTHDVGEAVFLADRIILLSPRPGRIFRTIEVEHPRPRRRENVALLQQEAEIYRLLHEIERSGTGRQEAPTPRGPDQTVTPARERAADQFVAGVGGSTKQAFVR